MTKLEAIKARVDAATEGPWKYETDERGEYVTAPIPIDWDEDDNEAPIHGVCKAVTDCGAEIANLKFIAHARTDIPWQQIRLEELAKVAREIVIVTGDNRLARQAAVALVALDESEKS